MARARKPKRSTTRKDVNTDPHWTNWEYLAAFGVDDLGYTYLDAVKQFCCVPNEEEAWLEDLVRKAHRAHDRAGRSTTGRQAAWRVLRRAGMILLHDLMDDLKVETGKRKPRAAFRWPEMAMTVIVTTNWKLDTRTD